MHKFGSLISALALAGASCMAQAGEWQALPDKAPEPASNPTTPAKVELGKMLYHDPRLSSSGTVACASCHNVMSGGEDNRGGSVGVQGQVGGRSAPTVWNSAFNSVQFWDGRAPSLEAQAKGPVTNPIEMGMKSWDDVVVRLKAIPGYVAAFGAAFEGADPVTADNAAKAIAAYERTLITPNSAYDKFAKGDAGALSEQQQRGLKTFAEVGCNSCHSGPAFNGPQLPEGTGFYQKFPMFDNGALEAQYGFTKDLGRAQETKNDADKHMFRVPTLRNIALTAPYFHNGKVKTLPDAVKVMGKTQLNKDLSQEQVDDIVAFLNALSGEFPKQEMPRLPALANKTFDFN
ncbi:cytochrome-c peroxidase [Methyloterricola oryzae]|uniref:cytochrome-c peroxidase n=1 Tax=Methyloterricola oryzae TaxID=1495050 RepID=UPI0005EB8699|nr:cytochrome c peroxidase [Methyloterricola oryzae]